MLTNTLVALDGCVIALLTLLRLACRITERQYTGGMALVYAVAAVGCAIAGWRTALYMNVAGGALFAWMWWNSGGGDDTKRRLKSWAGRFEGVRRTAPVAS
ncbi:hypothetical protein AB0454_22590 [Streptomyces sp. NPDC093509]|uniref:hypothetical protein n=1 Tax=Streptomyces sp. NPDC093509 TaxID=3154982 RepID=UPI00344D9111